MEDKLARLWFTIFAILICVSVAATFYRYIVKKDFLLIQSEPEIEANIQIKDVL